MVQKLLQWAMCALTIEVLFLLSVPAASYLAIAPLSASCILIMSNPSSANAHPRNVLFSYLLVGNLGLLASVFMGFNAFTMLGVILVSLLIMSLTGLTHPPAVTFPFVIMQTPIQLHGYLMTLIQVVVLLSLTQFFIQFLLPRLYPTSTDQAKVGSAKLHRLIGKASMAESAPQLVQEDSLDPEAILQSLFK